MLAKKLLNRIDQFYRDAQAKNPFFQKIERGECTAKTVQLFLENILHLIRFTPLHLEMAARSSERKDLSALSSYLRLKLSEETGHDAWAEDDLRRLAGNDGAATNPSVTPSMQAIVRFNETNIAAKPERYLAHILFAEYFTVIATPPMVKALQERCGVSPEALTVFTKHAELDQHHVQEWSEVLPTIIDEAALEDQLVQSLETTIAFYDRFCSEVAEAA